MSEPVRLRPVPLWDPPWGKEALEKKEEEEPSAYARGFKMQAVTEGEKTFPSFKSCRKHGVFLEDLLAHPWPAFTGVDLSGKKRKGNAIFTARIDPKTRRRYPVDIRYGKWRADELAEQLANVNNLLRPIVIMVETNGYQETLIDWCERYASDNDYWMKLEATVTNANKQDPEVGLPGLQVEYKREGWVVPYDYYASHKIGCVCAWCEWDRQVDNHPNAAATDLVMAQWFCRQGIELFAGSTIVQEIPNLKAR